MQTIQIRPITLNELWLVTPLFDQYRVFYKQPSNLSRAQSFLEERLGSGESVLLAALVPLERELTAIGFTQLYPLFSSVRLTKNWILNDLFVAPAHRNAGVGKQLILAASEFARTTGARFLQLETALTNDGARRLYESMGFIKQDPDNSFLTYHLMLTQNQQ